MRTPIVTAEVARRHAPLAQRAAAILSSLGTPEPVTLSDAAEPAPAASAPRLMLARGSRPHLRRMGAQGFALTYADPADEAALAALLAGAAPAGTPIAADPESLSVLALAERLAASDIPVLIGGPTGTGKEVLARFIHAHSPRSKGPFVAVNCAAMPEAMLEAMLFGHIKGAFTGAAQASEGFFRAAQTGTLLLDEIAELPLALQAKLLRALQEREVVPIGATKPIAVDARIVACANRDLATEVAEGRFRADLYYRLNVFPLGLRALAERPADIAPLAFAMVLRHTPLTRDPPWIAPGALTLLRLHGWPGNVRELENVIRRALLLADGLGEGGLPTASTTPAIITSAHIRFDGAARLVSGPGGQAPHADPSTAAITADRHLASIVQASEARAIAATLAACGGSRVAAARQLGISERTLRYRLAAMRVAGLADPAIGAAGTLASAGGRR